MRNPLTTKPRKIPPLLLAAGAVCLLLLVVALTVLRQVDGGSLDLPGRKKVARVDIFGPIVSSERTVELLRRYADDKRVGAILIRIDSPGGAVAPSQEISRELARIRGESRTKLVVSIGSLGASGGYYIASAAHRIYANPGSLVGSIGVILQLSNIRDLLGKIGVDHEVIKSGPYKDIGSPLRRMEPEERRLLQEVIDDTHRQFVQAVAQGRQMPQDEVAALADGRVFSGRQAKDLGLVDELGGLEDAVRGAAQLAGIQGRPEVVTPPKPWRWRELLEEAASLVRPLGGGGGGGGLAYLWQP
jgi:protease-4